MITRVVAREIARVLCKKYVAKGKVLIEEGEDVVFNIDADANSLIHDSHNCTPHKVP